MQDNTSLLYTKANREKHGKIETFVKKLYLCSVTLPQILIGASSSRRLGWLRKTSFEAKHSCFISGSVRCACFAFFPSFVSKSRRIISSSKFSFIVATQPKTLNLSFAQTHKIENYTEYNTPNRIFSPSESREIRRLFHRRRL